MSRRKLVKAESTHYTYVTLHNAAHYALKAAKDAELGRFLQLSDGNGFLGVFT